MDMTNQWLKSKGQLSIKALWVSFHYQRECSKQTAVCRSACTVVWGGPERNRPLPD